jgi:hypothetical protein
MRRLWFDCRRNVIFFSLKLRWIFIIFDSPSSSVLCIKRRELFLYRTWIQSSCTFLGYLVGVSLFHIFWWLYNINCTYSKGLMTISCFFIIQFFNCESLVRISNSVLNNRFRTFNFENCIIISHERNSSLSNLSNRLISTKFLSYRLVWFVKKCCDASVW